MAVKSAERQNSNGLLSFLRKQRAAYSEHLCSRYAEQGDKWSSFGDPLRAGRAYQNAAVIAEQLNDKDRMRMLLLRSANQYQDHARMEEDTANAIVPFNNQMAHRKISYHIQAFKTNVHIAALMDSMEEPSLKANAARFLLRANDNKTAAFNIIERHTRDKRFPCDIENAIRIYGTLSVELAPEMHRLRQDGAV